nr:MAG TPA: hypothetical protein [Caudoviricetes sp.]
MVRVRSPRISHGAPAERQCGQEATVIPLLGQPVCGRARSLKESVLAD